MDASHLSSLPCPLSALSPGVKRLLCRGHSATIPDQECLRAGVLNFDHIARLLPSWSEDTSDYFCEATSSLAPVFLQCEKELQGLSRSEFTQRYTSLLQWTGIPQFFLDCFENLQAGNGCDCLLALLMITSGLERSLGDVFLIRGQQCPSLLKALLLTQELENIFGATVIQMLRVVIGPPISLNIRNIVWHGFPSRGEIPDRFAWFLLLLVPSLGRCLHQQGVLPEEMPHRTPITFHHTDLLDKLLPGFEEDDLTSIQQLFLHTDFIQSQYTSAWEKCLQLYKQNSYGLCLVLLLPQLEHSLRRVFAAINGCPERVLTAEATTLYTTFDEILDKYLPSQVENALLRTIGENSMDLLFDLLVYPDGPRVRDRLSHGETTLDSLPQALVNAVISLAIKLSSLYVASDQTQFTQTPDIQRILDRVSEYRSLFHPISVAKRKVQDLAILTSQMDSWVCYTPQLEIWKAEDGMDVFLRDNIRFMEVKSQIKQVLNALSGSSLAVYIQTTDLTSCLTPFSDNQSVIQDILNCRHISTVYRGQNTSNQSLPSCPSDATQSHGEVRESEIVGLISRIISEEQEVMSQVKVAMATRQEQLKQKQLRSRQRDNLKRLLESLPVLRVMTTTLCLLTACLLAHLDQLTTLDQAHMKKLQKFLKSCLQYSENMRTFSNSDKNKWVECVDLTVKFLPRLMAAVEENMFLRSHEASLAAAAPP